ncbi:MAG: bifunctional 4-hydroxy-2-oxoglutarate aldolase/2-dehydro-3-deoxy-phosphogluconate aldolase [Cyanobacteria bacterium]|nr:bifunctional 4-hydroxy-2-oxoglutarate aldolase/2-dehydro-3-deoxy-phosphogluconate aldolase [Cyanobacteria bacterium CG_2015-16_32_12]NCO76693.1 bifunctional 4-hydroxy-2-oxoglutarate aldolase/2-dehydro-3-deoxy-phosphogluconate aldolase [Cyanobacteria bacterium CG_2015-22_32_23]NCQ03500.1 bifunctional 4-hydroxy-2-oxoglutarate aldolase/2-dehydro-3-deoxy-phosphogluconate aldolase [Cyanobacteria bacterium CG_2015-09_32_10]NCQ43221.1 bifunctional 4-hydroxy-2-oxoglutarate aldolase/2-dehydro-3-deoxy-
MLANWLSTLQNYRLIAVIRCDHIEQGKKMASILADSGVKLIEITWNSDQPAKLVTILREKLPHCYIGVGTIFHHQDLVTAMEAGSQFCFSPHFDVNLLKLAHNNNIPYIPGGLSPTEIINAFNEGAKTVKVFPIQAVGGVNYIKAIRSPISHIPFIPTGGVTIQSAPDYIKAGAIAVGLSTDLFPQDLLLGENWKMISNRVTKIQQELQSIKTTKDLQF